MSDQQSNSTKQLVFELLSLAENYILPVNSSNTAIVTEFSVAKLAKYIEANYLPRKQVETILSTYDTNHPQFCRKSGEQFKQCLQCVLEDIRSKLNLNTMYSGRPIPEANETKGFKKGL